MLQAHFDLLRQCVGCQRTSENGSDTFCPRKCKGPVAENFICTTEQRWAKAQAAPVITATASGSFQLVSKQSYNNTSIVQLLKDSPTIPQLTKTIGSSFNWIVNWTMPPLYTTQLIPIGDGYPVPFLLPSFRTLRTLPSLVCYQQGPLKNSS